MIAEFKYFKNQWYKKLISLKNDLSPLRTAVVYPADIISLQGAISSAQAGLIIPILVGPQNKILTASQEGNLDISSYQIIPTHHSE